MAPASRSASLTNPSTNRARRLTLITPGFRCAEPTLPPLSMVLRLALRSCPPQDARMGPFFERTVELFDKGEPPPPMLCAA